MVYLLKIKKSEERSHIEVNGSSLNQNLLLVYIKVIFEGYCSYDLRRPELRTNYYTHILVNCFPGPG